MSFAMSLLTFQHTHWTTASTYFGWNIATQYFQLWWSCLTRYFCLRFQNSSHEDVRVFNPLGKSHFNQSLISCYRKNEKKWAYEECIQNVKYGIFTPLVFAGGMGPLLPLFTEDWLHYLLIRCINCTIKQFIGFAVLEAFHRCNHWSFT